MRRAVVSLAVVVLRCWHVCSISTPPVWRGSLCPNTAQVGIISPRSMVWDCEPNLMAGQGLRRGTLPSAEVVGSQRHH